MASGAPRLMLRRRLLCTQVSKTAHNRQRWSIKQVKNSNFTDSLDEIKSHICGSDFVAVSLQKTGSFSAPWHRVSPFDTPETAYFKAKYAAERFQILQFAVCPFTLRASKVTAHPYNFHLFPRDEFNMGMPSYSFSCQTACLTAMAREGFDFNACIYDGISYLSRVQESAAKAQMENPVPAYDVVKSTLVPSVADKVFVERIKSRVKHWKSACTESSTGTEEPLVKCLRKIVLATEEFRSRPSMTIEVCSERQVELTLEMLQGFADDLFPLIVPAKSGGTQAVRVVLTSSKEDKYLLQRELESLEGEHNRKIRGFREVIDLISASQKPVVSHNSLNDFTFIHSKFLASLPPSMDEFMHSLRSAFPEVIDVNHLMKEIGPQRKVTNIPLAMSHLKSRFFAPIELEIPCQAMEHESDIQGHNVVRMCQLFAKLCHILKIAPDVQHSDGRNLASSLEAYANIFNPFSPGPQEASDEEIRIWTNSGRKVSCEDVVFLWGFRGSMTAGTLKSLLQESHKLESEDFDVRLVERGCAIVVFWQPGTSGTFLDVLNSSPDICAPLRELVAAGLKSGGYEIYSRACKLGLWEVSLANALDKSFADPGRPSESDSKSELSQSHIELMIDLDEL